MSEQIPSVYEQTPSDLAAWLQDQSQPAFRLNQLLDWLYRRFAEKFDDMSNLPIGLREALSNTFDMEPLRIADRLASQDGTTEKFAFALHDGEVVESVLMRGSKRSTFCVSSQVGCAMDCAFCATGKLGFRRNLSPGEIIGQVAAMCRANGNETGNVVFMGMGEPLANFDNLVVALEALTDEQRLAVGSRRITVSTVGIVKGIRRLAELASPPNLALSLNSPFAPVRAKMMPVTEQQRLDEVLKACEDYYRVTGRRVLIEYVVLGGINTDYEHARGVLRIARRLGGIVNLIAYNPVADSEFKQPSREEMLRLKEVLQGAGMNVTERYRRGRDIAAACGQLAGRKNSESRS